MRCYMFYEHFSQLHLSRLKLYKHKIQNTYLHTHTSRPTVVFFTVPAQAVDYLQPPSSLPHDSQSIYPLSHPLTTSSLLHHSHGSRNMRTMTSCHRSKVTRVGKCKNIHETCKEHIKIKDENSLNYWMEEVRPNDILCMKQG